MLDSRILRAIYVGLILLMVCNFPVCGLSVLCRSDSSHLKLETAWSSCCTVTDQSVSQEDLDVVSDDSECGYCTDISFCLAFARSITTSSLSVAQVTPVWASPSLLCDSMTPQAVNTPNCFFGLCGTPLLPIIGDMRLSSVIRC